MNWYLAKIVYRIICGQGNHTAQFDEQLRLIQAKVPRKLLKNHQLSERRKKINFTMKTRNWFNGNLSMWLNSTN